MSCFFSVLFHLVSIFFKNLPSFASTFWFRPFPLFVIFARCQRFLICVSILISHPGLEFLLVFLGETTYFSDKLLLLLSLLVLLLFLLFLEIFFHTSISWWSLTGDLATTNFLKFPGLFSVLWPISAMQYIGFSPLVLSCLSTLVFLPIFWGLYKWYNCYFHVPQFFQFPNKDQVLRVFFLLSFNFIIIVTYSLRVFTSVLVNCLSQRVWLTAGLLKSPRLLFSIML